MRPFQKLLFNDNHKEEVGRFLELLIILRCPCFKKESEGTFYLSDLGGQTGQFIGIRLILVL